MRIVHELKDGRISCAVLSEEVLNTSFAKQLKAAGIKCTVSLDPRSALYLATGMAAQSGEWVVCVVSSTNTSRSVFSGMTEAYYRNLPVILITLGTELNYSNELKDAVCEHFVIGEDDSIEQVFKEKRPAHVELSIDCLKQELVDCDEIQSILGEILSDSSYLYISAGIKKTAVDYSCKVVNGGMPGCYEGALANVLGASLGQIRKKYIGLLSEKECLHDLNTLGNINVNERLCYIVVLEEYNMTIIDYAKSLGYKVHCLDKESLNRKSLLEGISEKEKTIVLIRIQKRER